MRKLLFQLHWILGISIGTMMAFSGLTGAMLAFGPQLTDYFSGANEPVAIAGQPLDAAQLYERVHRARPDRQITKLYLYEEAGKPALVTYAALRSSNPGPTAPQSEVQRVNPYTGDLLPVKPVGRALRRFELWLRDVHQGHWFGPGTGSTIAAWFIGFGAVTLFVMALSGLYMRWPRGRSMRRWSAWFAINIRLKGRVFLFNLHAVLGTCAFVGLLVLAHSGAFQNGEMSWYGHAVRKLTGAPAQEERRGPPPGMGAGMGPPGVSAQSGPPPGGAPPMGGPGMGGMGGSSVVVYYMNAASYVNADTIETNVRRARLDTTNGTLQPLTESVPRTFGEKLVANNQNIHEGRIFGWGGTLVLMLSALMLPVFYITGWMMYLQRRRRAAGRKVEAQRSAA
ncbi:MAG: PepSY-associated TM helix domain-containing protein [Steroidobacteraceae bacterium]